MGTHARSPDRSLTHGSPCSSVSAVGAGGLVLARCRIPASLPPLLCAPKLQEKERNKAGQKKSLPALQRREEEGFSERAAADVSDVKSIQVR